VRQILIPIGLVIAAVGYCSGRIVTMQTMPVPLMTLAPDSRPAVAIVDIRGVQDGHLVGSTLGEVRLFLGDQQVLSDGSGAFRVPAGALKTDERTISVPSGMQFVASRRGKRLYPVHSAQAQQLVPENRVYFSSEEQARAAGYR
jgi:hypothetical protein